LDKAPDAFRTISEVADDLDIPQHVLRFWETRFSQIKPMKRSGGRRYYRPDDVDLLRGIRRLLYGEGYTIRGVQRILKENGIKAVQGLVDERAAPSFAPVRGSEPSPRSEPSMTRPAPKPPVVADEPEEDPEAELEEEFEDAEEEEEEEAADEDASDEDSDEETDEDDAEVDEEADDDAADADEGDADTEEAEPVAARAPEVRGDPAMRAVTAQQPGRTEPVMSRANPMPQPRANPVPPPRSNPQPRPDPALGRERLEAVLEELLAARRALDAAMKDGE
jgi:DNA-binding transcriptional MerR regulator